MINIAICDDLEKGRKLVYNEVIKYLDEGDEKYDVQIFCDSKELLNEIEKGITFDILLLDVEMPEMDGFELTEKLKAINQAMLVIFVTAYEKYVYDSFKVQPYRFIPKDRIREMLLPAMKDAIKHIKNQSNKTIIIKNRDVIKQIPIRNIVYVYREGKYVNIRMSDNQNEKDRKSLKEIYSKLVSENFIIVERGYICNLAYIKNIDEQFAYLINGENIPIARERLSEVRDNLLKYLIKNGGV